MTGTAGNISAKAARRARFFRMLKNQRYLFLLMALPIIWYIVFCYIPIGGLILAFKNYKFSTGVFGSAWAGLDNFKNLFSDFYFPLILRNTVATSALKLVFGFPVPIILAIMLNEMRLMKVKRVVQTISYLPYFVSWVVVVGILRVFLTVDGGIFNKLLMSLGVIERPISWLQRSSAIWPIVVVSDIWKNMGWNSIIYLAAIAGIEQDMYEAADIDGASRLRKIWSITLPSIRGTIVILLIMNMGTLFSSNFDQMYMLNIGAVGDVAETIDTYIYNFGVKKLNYGIGTALSIVRTVVVFALIWITNRAARALGESGIW